MTELMYGGIAIVPLLIGLLEVIKKTGFNEKYIPILSIVLGSIIGIVLFSDGDIINGIVQGMYIGLSAIGLYSGTKNTIQN